LGEVKSGPVGVWTERVLYCILEYDGFKPVNPSEANSLEWVYQDVFMTSNKSVSEPRPTFHNPTRR
jgi:hypothetical protein